MRKNKFRVWDNDDKSFFKPTYEAYKGRLEDLSISLCGEILRRTFVHCSEHQSCFPDKYILEQFTGLKDKKGVEIYEGDIVQAKSSDVIHPQDLWKYKEEYIKSKIYWESHGFETDFGYSALFDSEKVLTVIGNIHQNPELL